MSSWHSYPSIYNLGHRALEHLFDNPVLIEEKVDGSQLSFGLINGELKAKSKGKELVIDAPEKMFQSAIDVIRTLDLHPGWTYRGEYLQKCKHNCLNYGRIPNNHIIIFDINTDEERYLDYNDMSMECVRIGLECVPLLYYGIIESTGVLVNLLTIQSVLGNTSIEGIVIKNYAQYGLDKKVLMGKFVSEAFKEKHVKDWKEANPVNKDVIQRLINTYKSEARWMKAVQHLRDAGELENSPRDIGKLIHEIPNDVLKEDVDEIKEVLFKFAWPHIARGITSEFPEWYKNKLMEEQFSA